MSDELEDIVDNISQQSFWVRILLMIVFALASYFVLLPLIIVLSIAQMLFTLVTGQSNANLRYFSATLALYVPQVIGFLTYLSEDRPYPFSDLPEVEDDSLEQESSAKSANKKAGASAKVEDKPAAKKKAAPKKAKKKAAKKKVAKKSSKAGESSKAESASDDASAA